MKLLPAGRDGLLVELDSLAQVQRLYAELRRRTPRGIVDIVPAARTVLLVGPGTGRVAKELTRWQLPEISDKAGALVEIPVIYDGEDLGEVSQITGLPVDGIVKLHSGTELRAAFCGFVPGFAYLGGLPGALQVPRRDTPRTQVPAGSVALAGEFTGVYPRATPGGWRLIGRTELPMWDARRDPPSLLAPGMRVRFVAVKP